MALDWSGIISSGIGAIGNVITGGLSARKQYKYQSKLMDKQFGQTMNLWNLNNEYNTPVAQRARLEAANLNPDLMYGSGGVQNTSMSANAGTNGTAPDVDYGKPSEAISNAMQYSLINAQADKMNEETRLAAERAQTEAVSRELMMANARLSMSRAIGQETYNKFAADRHWLENEQLEYNNSLKKMDMQSYQYRLDLDARRVANDNMRVKNQLLQLGLNGKKLDADLSKIRAEVAEIMSRVKVNNAQQRKIIADAIETEALNHYYYKNGMIPTSNTLGWIANSVTNAYSDFVDPYNPEK
uniref:DNA pilot protein n=1 Tax=Dulem virus 180 TaxID=3145657 RepID=A0AAU8B8K9_9VIRU